MYAALFLLDLLSVFDRGYAVRLVALFMDGAVPPKCTSSQKQLLESCKMDALSGVLEKRKETKNATVVIFVFFFL
jgi:hypothetical protein